MNILSKSIGAIFTVLFIYAAIVQFNDIDAILWIALYSVAAMGSALFVLDRLKKHWAMILAVVYMGLAIYFWPSNFEGVGLQDGMKTINIELGRESLGMGICSLMMFVYFAILQKKSMA